jgi:FtsH-binding integral membrane protein
MDPILIKKAPFMGMVFANLIFQSLVAYTTAVKIDKKHVADNILKYIIASVLLILVLAVMSAYKVNIPAKFIVFTMYSIVSGALLSTRKSGLQAIREVGAIFGAMFVLGIVSIQLKIDVRPYFPILALILLGVLLSRFIGVEKKNNSTIVSVLLAIFVVFDTNNIIQKDYDGDFIQASLDYFLDIINLLNEYEE